MITDFDDTGLVWTRQTRRLPRVKTNIAPRMCSKPWHEMQLDKQGRVFICGCNGWLPFPVGYITDFETIDQIYQSHNAKIIQQTIIDGTYEFCDTKHCPVTTENCIENFPPRYFIEIGIDESCNLACPSCRKHVIFNDNGDIYNKRLEWVSRINDWISKSPSKNFLLSIGSDGEPFASPLYIDLLKNNSLYKNVKYMIRSNGTLIKRHIDSLNILPHLENIDLSIDAASKEVYEDVRRPGKWNNLLENIDYLIELRKKYEFRIEATFVIQKSNIDDVLNFIDFCQSRKIIPRFHLLQDWASFDNFDEQCVHRPTDKLYKKFLQIIKTPKFRALDVGWVSNYL